MRVRTVTVDFWGTLVLEPPGADDRYQAPRLHDIKRLLLQNGFDCSQAQLTRAYQASGDVLRKMWSTRRDVGVVEHVRAILRALDDSLPARIQGNALDALVDAYARPLLMDLPTADPGARDALVRLRDAGIALVIVSNTMRTPGMVLRQALEKLSLLECFQKTFFSDELGVRKPDPTIFATALHAVGGEPKTAVHVGDDPILDVQGAREAGLRTIQITAKSGIAPTAERPDRAITCFDELPAAIAALERAAR